MSILSPSTWKIGDRTFTSRLLVGTGKFSSNAVMADALVATGTEIVTVALRRVRTDGATDDLLAHLEPKRYRLLPNTSGVRDRKEAILAAELARTGGGPTLYLLDEPTTGLHFADVEKLLQVLHRLVDQGNTVLVIEHNLDVIKTADWLVDLGPEGGDGGGRILVSGTPEMVAKHKTSHTSRFLKPLLERKA